MISSGGQTPMKIKSITSPEKYASICGGSAWATWGDSDLPAGTQGTFALNGGFFH